VYHLRSPPDYPEYNGACEAGIGSMKTRTHHQAARRGQPGAWGCDDAEAARRQANETARPWGARGPTPAEAWARRRVLTSAERADFGTIVRRLEQGERASRDVGAAPALSDAAQAALNRAVLTRALVEVGILAFSSERASP
jgi:hypothetical protein